MHEFVSQDDVNLCSRQTCEKFFIVVHRARLYQHNLNIMEFGSHVEPLWSDILDSTLHLSALIPHVLSLQLPSNPNPFLGAGHMFIGFAYLCKLVEIHAWNRSGIDTVATAANKFLLHCVESEVDQRGGWENCISMFPLLGLPIVKDKSAKK